MMLLCESFRRVLCCLCEGDMHGAMRRDRGEGKNKKHMLGECFCWKNRDVVELLPFRVAQCSI